MIKRATPRTLALAALLALAGCPRPPLRFGPEGEIADPQLLLRMLAGRAARVSSLKAEAKVSVKTPRQSGSAGEFVAVQRPASLHLETLNFFGKPVAVLASDGERFSLYSEQDASFTTGPASPANVSRLLPFTLDPREAVELLLGQAPILAGAEARLEIDAGEGAYRLTLTRGAVEQRLWVATEDLRPLRSQIRGASAYDLALSDYQEFGGLVFPTRLDLRTVDASGRPSGIEVTLRYKDLELNPALEPELFTLEAPPGTRRVEVDEAGRPLP